MAWRPTLLLPVLLAACSGPPAGVIAAVAGPTAPSAVTAADELPPLDAAFTAECGYMYCVFTNTTEPSTEAGSIVSCDWDIGGTPVERCAFWFDFQTTGTKAVTLTVVDDQGATGATAGSVEARESPIHLTARHYEEGREDFVELRWSGAETARVEILRTGSGSPEPENPMTVTVDNEDGENVYVDRLGRMRRAAFIYTVSEVDGDDYSYPLRLSFGTSGGGGGGGDKPSKGNGKGKSK